MFRYLALAGLACAVALSPAYAATTCMVSVKDCPAEHQVMPRSLPDSTGGADKDARACMARAEQVKSRCGTSGPVTASYRSDGRTVQTTTAPGVISPSAAAIQYYVDPSLPQDIYDGLAPQPTTVGTVTHGPFQTIADAKLRVQTTLSTDHTDSITVWLRGGNYFIFDPTNPSTPLSFGTADSGNSANNQYVTWAAYVNPAGKTENPVISGGRLLSGWATTTVNGQSAESVAVGNSQFRQLYINQFDSTGRILQSQTKLTRARSPRAGSRDLLLTLPSWVQKGANWPGNFLLTVPGGVEANDLLASSSSALNATEIVMRKTFGLSRLQIGSIAPIGTTGSFGLTANPTQAELDVCASIQLNPSSCNISPSGGPFYYNNGAEPFHYENNIHFVQQPGDWYLDQSAGNLYFIPPSSVNLSTAQVIVPNGTLATDNNVLLSVGQSGPNNCNNPVSNMQFIGLTVSHSNWLQPNQPQGYVQSADPYYYYYVPATATTSAINAEAIPAAVQLGCTTNTTFAYNSFSQLGDAGLSNTVLASSTNLTVYGNAFTQIAAGAMYLTSGGAENLVISSNMIAGVGGDYGGSGILVWGSNSVDIEHNDIRSISAQGIEVEPGDDQFYSALHTTEFPLTISENLLSNTSLDFSDTGAIYVDNTNPQSVIDIQQGTDSQGNALYVGCPPSTAAFPAANRQPGCPAANPLFNTFPSSFTPTLESSKVLIESNLINATTPLANTWLPSTTCCGNPTATSPFAIYLDTGTEGAEVTNNIFANTPFSYKLNCETNNSIFNNQLDPNQVDLTLYPGGSVTYPTTEPAVDCDSVTVNVNSKPATASTPVALPNAAGLYSDAAAIWSGLQSQYPMSPSPAGCVPQAVSWSGTGGASCSATTGTATNGQNMSVSASDSGVTGTETLQCNNSVWTVVPGTSSCTLQPVNGVCGAAAFTCNAGTNTNDVTNSSGETWTCAGINGGSNASCSAAAASCASATESWSGTGGASCSATTGTATSGQSVTQTGYGANWDVGPATMLCTNGAWSITSSSCASKPPVNGTCGTTAFSCASGTDSGNATTSSGQTWQCQGSVAGPNSYPGTNASCSLAACASTTETWGTGGASCSALTGTALSGQSVTPTGYGSNWDIGPATMLCTNGSWSITSSSCASKPPVNGTCGTTAYSCAAGTDANNGSTSTTETWQCVGSATSSTSYPGTTASCSVAKVNGQCGASPYSCTAGTDWGNTSNSGGEAWYCLGINGGTNAPCTAAPVVTGKCGTATFTCSAGTDWGNVTNSGGNAWYCLGSGGGANAPCTSP